MEKRLLNGCSSSSISSSYIDLDHRKFLEIKLLTVNITVKLIFWLIN